MESKKTNKTEGKKLLEPRTHFTIWNLVIAIGIMFLLQTYLFAPREEHIAYSQFEELIQNDQVKEVVIGPEIIEGIYKGQQANSGKPKAFKTVRVDDPDLVKDLNAHGIQFSGQYQSSLLKGILGWVLPMIIFFGVWALIVRKMSPGAGVMSFGKNKAKLYAQETGITFNDVAGVDEAKEELKEIVAMKA